MSENCVLSPSRQFLDIFRTFVRHFSDILSTFLFCGLSNNLPVTSLKSPPGSGKRSWSLKKKSPLGSGKRSGKSSGKKSANRFPPKGVVRQHSVLRRVLRRFWEGFWGSQKGSEKGSWCGFYSKKRVLRRVLRRGSETGVSRRCLDSPLRKVWKSLGSRPPLTGVSRALRARNPRRVSRGLPAPGSKKCPQQSQNSLRSLKTFYFETPETVLRLFRTLFVCPGRLFRDSFGTPGPEGPGRLL